VVELEVLFQSFRADVPLQFFSGFELLDPPKNLLRIVLLELLVNGVLRLSLNLDLHVEELSQLLLPV
jgi:hypothetical protein